MGFTKNQMGFTNDQIDALDKLEEGKDIFLTGGAGTGKSYLLSFFIETQRGLGKNIAVCAPTGVAAAKLGGSTLHSIFNMDIHPKITEPNTIPEFLQYTDIIIIDEISMVRIDNFDFVYKTIQMAEDKWNTKIQKIVCGDFYQLPPVVGKEDWHPLRKHYGKKLGHLFAFQSALWDFQTVELKEVVRQKDKDFVAALNDIRIGKLESFKWILDHSSKKPFPKYVWLMPTNTLVKDKNDLHLRSFDKSTQKTYKMIGGTKTETHELCFEREITLRKGVEVMILKNDNVIPSRYVNGSVGVVDDLWHDSVDVFFENTGYVLKFKYENREIFEYDVKQNDDGSWKLVATPKDFYSQIPIKMSHAMTVHKSQGQTFEKANISLGDWAPGLLYTELSRVTAVENIYFDIDSAEVREKGIKLKNNCCKDVQEFYDNPEFYKFKWDHNETANFEENEALYSKIDADTTKVHLLYGMSMKSYESWYNECVGTEGGQ